MFPEHTNFNLMKYTSFHSHFQIKEPAGMKHEERGKEDGEKI